MIKSVYDESLDIVNEALEQPDNSVIFKHTSLNVLKKVIEQAKKQEKDLKWQNENADDLCIRYTNTNELLKLYKEKSELLSLQIVGRISMVQCFRLTEINNLLKEIENNE